MKPLALLLLLAVAALPVSAQPADARAQPADARARPADAVPPDPAAMTRAEKHVANLIQTEGIHIVHFWAPWCDNSIAELRSGWYELVERHPDVSFTFVTIWNDGESGRETMDRFGLGDRVGEVTQPDFGPSDDKAQRRRTFLGLPVTWIPTTWVFHKSGELAYAFNYGELEMEQLDRAIAGTRSTWPHE